MLCVADVMRLHNVSLYQAFNDSKALSDKKASKITAQTRLSRSSKLYQRSGIGLDRATFHLARAEAAGARPIRVTAAYSITGSKRGNQCNARPALRGLTERIRDQRQSRSQWSIVPSIGIQLEVACYNRFDVLANYYCFSYIQRCAMRKDDLHMNCAHQ